MLNTSNSLHPFNRAVTAKPKQSAQKPNANPEAVATRRSIEEFHEQRRMKQDLNM